MSSQVSVIIRHDNDRNLFAALPQIPADQDGSLCAGFILEYPYDGKVKPINVHYQEFLRHTHHIPRIQFHGNPGKRNPISYSPVFIGRVEEITGFNLKRKYKASFKNHIQRKELAKESDVSERRSLPAIREPEQAVQEEGGGWEWLLGGIGVAVALILFDDEGPFT